MPTYKDAGVDLDRADRLVNRLADYQRLTEEETSRTLLEGVGQFASSYDLGEYDRPAIVSTCDGVGTKFLLQKKHDRLESAGRDLVAMNVNDVLTTGADPLMFMDYVAMSPLDETVVEPLVKGMTESCLEVDCLLAGGETAELPGMLEEGEVELAGFCVGAAEKDRLESSPPPREGQRIVGLPSSGFHANGFSLVRLVLDENSGDFTASEVHGLLEPTRLYREPLRELREVGVTPAGMVHVTGGGIRHNLLRVLPENLGARLDLPRWESPAVRKILERVEPEEALRTFNMGFGWLLVIPEEDLDPTLGVLPEAEEIGFVTGDRSEVTVRYGSEKIR